MKVWGGAIGASTQFHLGSNPPTYRFSTKVEGLDLQQAVDSQLHFLKNTVVGKAHFEMTGEGASFNPAPAIDHLKANGKLKVDKAKFATIDVGKMAGDALNQAIEKLAEKIPAAKGKKINPVPSGESRYDSISSDFGIVGGKFTAPNFYAKAEPNHGIDLKGNTEVGLKDYSLKTNWEVIDTYNLTHARDLSIDQNGVRVDHILAEGNNPVKFPVHAGCTVMAPCYSYTEVPEYLAGIALRNASKALTGKAKEELKKQAEGLLKNAPPALQDKLKGLFH
jgi:hypothetical protein